MRLSPLTAGSRVERFRVLAPRLRFIPGCLAIAPLLMIARLANAQVGNVPLMIRGTSVIDPARGTVTPNRSIVMVGTRITTIGGPATVAPSGARVIDGRGTFAIPGLWDMHAHAVIWGLDETIFPLNIANGVTGIREMWGVTTDAKRAREAVTSGRMTGPRFVFSGNIVDGWPPTRPGEVVVRTPNQGRRAVDSLTDAGAEFIKVYSLLDSASFDAIAERAKARGITIAGHVPMSVTAVHAARMGQKSFEHLEGVTAGCSKDERGIVDARVRWLGDRVRDSAGASTLMSEMRRGQASMRRSFDPVRCDALLRQLAVLGVWQVPTMGVLRAVARMGDPALVRPERSRYLAPMLRQMWDGLAGDTTFTRDTTGRVFNREVERAIVKRMARLDVPVLAGTDSPNPFTYPGFGLHDELELLVEAGFTPLHALRAATINPARYFAATDSMGSVAKGKVADLVLLESNPLLDIRNSRKIRAVVADGRFFDRVRLDSLLEVVAQRAAVPPASPKP